MLREVIAYLRREYMIWRIFRSSERLRRFQGLEPLDPLRKQETANKLREVLR